jgi:hypothetical protein
LLRDGAASEPETHSPCALLDFIAEHESAGVFHLNDSHDPWRESPEIQRLLRDVYQNASGEGRFVVICSPMRFIPGEHGRRPK